MTERVKIYTSYTQMMHDRSLTWLGTDTSMKRGEVKKSLKIRLG